MVMVLTFLRGVIEGLGTVKASLVIVRIELLRDDDGEEGWEWQWERGRGRKRAKRKAIICHVVDKHCWKANPISKSLTPYYNE